MPLMTGGVLNVGAGEALELGYGKNGGLGGLHAD